MEKIDVEGWPTGCLTGRVGVAAVKAVAALASGDNLALERVWALACGEEGRLSGNALWALTHLPEGNEEWLRSHRDEMADMLLSAQGAQRKRLLLELLRRQEYAPEEVRTDLLDFCLGKINSQHEPYAVRAFSIYAALRMCRAFPELLGELELHLDMLEGEELSAGLRSAVRQTRRVIEKCTKCNS